MADANTLKLCKDSWYISLASSGGTMVVGILLILLHRSVQVFVHYINYSLSRKKKIKSQANKHSNHDNKLGLSQHGLQISPPNTSMTNRDNESANNEIPADLRMNHMDINYINVNISCMTEAKDWAGSLISGQTYSGRLMMVFIFLVSIGSIVLYIYDTTWVKKNQVVECDNWSTSVKQQIDFSFNLIFLVYFFVRFLAANDKLWFWFELHSIVDVLTVPPAFVAVFLPSNWIGLRFVRAVRLMSLPDIVQYLNLVRTSTAIRLMQLSTFFLTLVLTTAGFIHLVENSGDPPSFRNGQNLTYFDSLYYIVVTFSTVGFGDVRVITITGKSFMLLFILGGLAVFANSLPEIADIVSTRDKYSGVYKKNKPHVVVCGHITYDTISNFLGDFLHKDREDCDVEIVILDNQEPNIEMESILKRYNIQVKFFKGSVMNSRDLDRIYLDQADCCLVLTNKYTNDPDSEDAANIMRVISIKNYSSNIKVIIQLIQYHNKAYLLNIPNWRIKSSDDVVCLAELKLGFMAVSCLAPGFSTLIANLFTMRAFKNDLNVPQWQNEYLEGAGMELYSEYFSMDFIGLTFHEAVLLAYEKLNLLLIAIQVNHNIIINPDKSNFIITNPSTQGFFIAQSSEEVKRAFYYCYNCHSNLLDPDFVKPCPCDTAKTARNKVIAQHLQRRNTNISLNSTRSISTTINHQNNHYNSIVKARNTRAASFAFPNRAYQSGDELFLRLPPSNHGSQHINRPNLTNSTVTTNLESEPHTNSSPNDSGPAIDDGNSLNITGSFYWCSDRSIEEAILTQQKIESDPTLLYDHIIVCLFAESLSPLIGLRNFMFPLRSARINYQELIPVIVIGSIDYIKREWKTLMNFPKLYLFLGSPLNRMVLRTVRIDCCKICMILSAKQSMNMDDQSLVDKEAILCCLNIKAMQFDTNTNNIWTYGTDIPLVTELSIDNNVQFLDQDDDDDPDGEIFMAQPFACGSVFTVSVLDSLMSTAYFNEDALGLIRTLVSGGIMQEFEQLLAEGSGYKGRLIRKTNPNNTKNESEIENLSQLKLLPLNKDPLLKSVFNFSKSTQIYEELFLNSVKQFGVLCIGIFRRIDIYEPDDPPDSEEFPTNLPDDVINTSNESEDPGDDYRNNPCKRYVITNPSPQMKLYKSDLIYCLSSDSRNWNFESDI